MYLHLNNVDRTDQINKNSVYCVHLNMWSDVTIMYVIATSTTNINSFLHKPLEVYVYLCRYKYFLIIYLLRLTNNNHSSDFKS